jgi:F0F1-type ATP synthase membrane subunit c/vacuolar-type H+-ATPase subunit K
MYFSVLFFTLIVLGISQCFAQNALGYSYTVQMENNEGNAGEIVVYKNGIYSLSTKDYENAIFGVITNNSIVSMEDNTIPPESSRKIISSGQAFVRVSPVNGNIKKGDYVTTSTIKGVGMKATKSGNVVGIALQDYESTDKDGTDSILVFINIQSVYIENNIRVNLVEALRGGTVAPFITPITSMRYLLAVLVITASFIIGFRSFGRSSSGSIEALGRNPLAKNTIRSAVVFNFILTFLIMLFGIIFSYLILVL